MKRKGLGLWRMAIFAMMGVGVNGLLCSIPSSWVTYDYVVEHACTQFTSPSTLSLEISDLGPTITDLSALNQTLFPSLASIRLSNNTGLISFTGLSFPFALSATILNQTRLEHLPVWAVQGLLIQNLPMLVEISIDGHVAQLTIEECTTLVSVIWGPSVYTIDSHRATLSRLPALATLVGLDKRSLVTLSVTDTGLMALNLSIFTTWTGMITVQFDHNPMLQNLSIRSLRCIGGLVFGVSSSYGLITLEVDVVCALSVTLQNQPVTTFIRLNTADPSTGLLSVSIVDHPQLVDLQLLAIQCQNLVIAQTGLQSLVVLPSILSVVILQHNLAWTAIQWTLAHPLTFLTIVDHPKLTTIQVTLGGSVPKLTTDQRMTLGGVPKFTTDQRMTLGGGDDGGGGGVGGSVPWSLDIVNMTLLTTIHVQGVLGQLQVKSAPSLAEIHVDQVQALQSNVVGVPSLVRFTGFQIASGSGVVGLDQWSLSGALMLQLDGWQAIASLIMATLGEPSVQLVDVPRLTLTDSRWTSINQLILTHVAITGSLYCDHCQSLWVQDCDNVTSITTDAQQITLDSLPALSQLSLDTLEANDLVLTNLTALMRWTSSVTVVDSITLDQTGLVSLQGLANLVQVHTSLMVVNHPALTRLMVGATHFRECPTLVLRGNPVLESLDGWSGLAPQSVQIVDHPRLWDYESLENWPVVPSAFDVYQSCCPNFGFFQPSISIWTPDDFEGCMDCVQAQWAQAQWSSRNTTVMIGPDTGGILMVLDAVGPIETDTVQVSFDGGRTFYDCPVTFLSSFVSTLQCETLEMNETVGQPLWMSIAGRPTFVVNANWTTVSFYDFLSVNWDWNATSVLFPTQFHSSTIPGLAESQSDLVLVLQTRLLLGTLAVLVGLVVVMTLFSVCLRRNLFRIVQLNRCDCFYRTDLSRYMDDGMRLLRREPTLIGGAMVLLGVTLITALCSAVLLAFLLDNVTNEILNLPVTTPTALQSTYRATVDWMGYSGNCNVSSSSAQLPPFSTGGSGGSGGQSCHSDLAISSTGLSGNVDVECERMANQTCRIVLQCLGCNLATGTVHITVENRRSNLAVLAFSWTLISIDYFGQESMVSGILSPPEFGALWKGRPYALLVVTAAPATFESSVDDRPSTSGVLMQFGGITPGNLVTPATFGDAQGVGFSITMPGLSSLIRVRLLPKQTLLALLAQLLAIGGVFNAMALCTAVIHWFYSRSLRSTSFSTSASSHRPDQTPPMSTPFLSRSISLDVVEGNSGS